MPTRTPSIRVLSAATSHHDCSLALFALSKRVDLERICELTEFKVPFGQDPQAFQRGEMFERRVKERGYADLLRLLREEAHLQLDHPRIVNLRDQAPKNTEGLKIRNRLTKQLLKQIAEKNADAPNIIDGAVLAVKIGEKTAYFEADGLAAAADGMVHVVEVKSFPITDGRCESTKLGAAVDQAAWYGELCAMVFRDLGFTGREVSRQCYIVLPLNVGLRPVLVPFDFSARMDRARAVLQTAQDAAVDLRDDPTCEFPSHDDPEVVDKLLALIEKVGTRYRGECLVDCGLSRLCRRRCHDLSLPALCGPHIEQQMAGIVSLRRASELTGKVAPSSLEMHAAAQLKVAARLYDRAFRGAR